MVLNVSKAYWNAFFPGSIRSKLCIVSGGSGPLILRIPCLKTQGRPKNLRTLYCNPVISQQGSNQDTLPRLRCILVSCSAQGVEAAFSSEQALEEELLRAKTDKSSLASRSSSGGSSCSVEQTSPRQQHPAARLCKNATSTPPLIPAQKPESGSEAAVECREGARRKSAGHLVSGDTPAG